MNVPQVAGGAVAAVVAAKLASWFGVYGTILGAGLVSVIATCGGTVFQHFFRRTGEQLREATVTSKAQATEQPRPLGEFTEGTVYRARLGSRRRPLLAAAVVFGIAMAGITAYELASGDSFSGGKGTTVAAAVSGHDASSSKSRDGGSTSTPAATPSAGATDDTTKSASPSADATSGGDTTSGASPSPGSSESGGAPTPTPSASESATAPAPSASSRSGTGDQDQADPAER